jgi:proline dehydrogenase
VNPLNSLLARTLPFVPRPIVRRVASRYVAGETLADAVETVRRLNAEGCLATLDVLGEDVVRMSETEETVTEYRQALDAIAENGLGANISVKLTALGLKLDAARCR